jgi:small subunit ribosomal protein S6
LRDYEILYIVRPELDDDQLNQAVERVNALIANVGGEHVKTDVWGKRRLAYEVDRLREGYYVLTDFKVDPERVPEMESTLKISDTVFRHLIVRKPAKAATATATAAAPAAAAPAPAPAAPPAEPAPAEATAEAPAAPTEPATDGEASLDVRDAEEVKADAAADEAEEAEAEVGVEPNLGELEEES